MGIGLSDGTNYADMGEWMANIHSSDASRMPLGGPTEPAGALKPSGGTETPANSDLPNWEGYNQPFGSLKGTAPEDTPVVFETKTGIKITEGDIQRGTDIAMSAGPLMVVGGQAGLGAKYWENLFKYDKMKKAGASQQELIEATGMFEKGPTGRLVHELSDENMKLIDKDWMYGESGKLSDFIEHPKLFEAYPALKDVNFKVADESFEWIGGYNDATKTLTINPRRIPSGDEGILDVIAHELQHWVQVKEGFPRGGNPDMALKDAVWALGSKAQQTPEGPERTEMMKLMADIARNAKAFANYMYQRIPGEVEANATMARRKLSDQQRKAFPIDEFNKFMEGSENTMSGGKYYPEFNYPKPEPRKAESAMAEVSDIRRAANDNKPVKEWVDENGMIRNPEADKAMDDSWNKMVRESAARESKNKELIDARDKLREILETRDWSDLEIHKYNKLGQELFGENYVPVDK